MRKNVFQCRITTLVGCIAMLMQLAAIEAALGQDLKVAQRGT